MREIKHIFVHCTASNQWTTTEATLRAEFKRKGWKQVGYHYIIMPNGNIIQMLADAQVANGVKNYNSNGLHVAWVGGYTKSSPQGIDNRTQPQKNSLRVLLKRLKQKYPHALILGHRDISPDINHNGVVDPWERIKSCPCFDALVEYKDLNEHNDNG